MNNDPQDLMSYAHDKANIEKFYPLIHGCWVERRRINVKFISPREADYLQKAAAFLCTM